MCAFGIGTTDVFNSWITKDVRVKVPESVKIVIRGKKHANVTAKDFILKILVSIMFAAARRWRRSSNIRARPSKRSAWTSAPP